MARGGTSSVIGCGGTVTVPPVALIGDEKSIKANLVGSWSDLYELIELHAAGRTQLRSETQRLSDINAVLDKLRAGEVTGRAVLVPDQR